MTEIRFPTQEFLDSLSGRTIPLRMEYRVSAMHEHELPRPNCPEIAIVGRSNVGKSSLLNFLAGQKQLARVSSTPGRTQTINIFAVEKGQFNIIDLPGYGFAKSPRETRAHWETSMSQFFSQRKSLVGVLFLVDVRRDVQEEDVALSHWLQDQDLAVLAVQTKCDKVHKSQWHPLRMRQAHELGVAPGMVITTSASEKIGLKELCTGIAGLIVSARPTPAEG